MYVSEERRDCEYYEGLGVFTDDQIGEIRWGFKKGLTVDQVALYAKPEFDYWQMVEIQLGFEYQLATEQLAIYAKPEFGAYQMRQIRLGLEDDLTIEQLAIYAKPEFDHCQMREIRSALRDGLPMGQMELFAKPEFDFEQMRIMWVSLRHEVTEVINWSPKTPNCRKVTIYKKMEGGKNVYHFDVGCQKYITEEVFVDRIYHKDGGLGENPHRQEYLDLLGSLE